MASCTAVCIPVIPLSFSSGCMLSLVCGILWYSHPFLFLPSTACTSFCPPSSRLNRDPFLCPSFPSSYVVPLSQFILTPSCTRFLPLGCTSSCVVPAIHALTSSGLSPSLSVYVVVCSVPFLKADRHVLPMPQAVRLSVLLTITRIVTTPPTSPFQLVRCPAFL